MKKFKEYVTEVQSPDILPPSGAGNDATETVVKKYAGDTPGQNHKDIKRQIKGDISKYKK